MLSEKRLKKVIYYIILFISCLNEKNQSSVKQISEFQKLEIGLGQGREEDFYGITQ